MSVGKRGIIRRMREFIRKYRYVRFVNNYIQNYLRNNSDKFPRVSEDTIMMPGFKPHRAVDMYVKKSGLDVHTVNEISGDACNRGYFDTNNGQGLRLTDKGRKLLDFPLGTLDDFLSEYGSAISFLTGAFFVAVVFGLGKLIELIWHLL